MTHAMPPRVTLRPARLDELPAVEDLLRRAGLPAEGIAELAGLVTVADAGGRVVGSAALEPYGAAGLLRSVAVAPEFQGQGLGARLTDATLGLARRRQMRRVYLLTETAARFFPRFGFRVVARDEVDPLVRTSPEFARLCPDSAVAMALDVSAEPSG